ncbi:MAG: alpha/beta fold hydrolase [Dehalococcoidia bacterium]
MPVFDSNGVAIHYETFGDEALSPVVLVHGFASSLNGNWVAPGWIETLKPLRRIVALDCRGHGESGKPHDAEAYSGGAMPGDVIGLMDHLGIECADLIGYSMGSRISLQLIMSQPQRFTSCILGGVGGVPNSRGGGRPNVVEALLADDASIVNDPVGRGFRVFAERNGNDLKALAACMGAGRAVSEGAPLGEISMPVLIVNGEKDTTVGSPDGLAAAIPDCRLIKVPERNHLTVVGDQRFKDAAVAFLSEHSA